MESSKNLGDEEDRPQESSNNPEDKEKQQESKSPQKSEEQPKTMRSLMVRIPTEYLTERQKNILCKRPQSKDEPSTSSEKKEEVFKVPQVPPIRKKTPSPSKTCTFIASKSLSTDVVQTVQDASLDESTAPETTRDASLDEETK